MDDRPILFSGPMIRALLAGRKTQTRRILKPQPTSHVWRYGWSEQYGATWSSDGSSGRIPIWVGHRLWVKETVRAEELPDGLDGVRYLADDAFVPIDNSASASIAWLKLHTIYGKNGATSPSIFMPRWASRLTLTVTDVKVERLQDISEEDARAEGIHGIWDGTPFTPDPGATNKFTIDIGGGNLNAPTAVGVYRMLWEWINGEGSWDSNPWVACYSFTVAKQNIDQIARAA